jgi:uncharacterized protein
MRTRPSALLALLVAAATVASAVPAADTAAAATAPAAARSALVPAADRQVSFTADGTTVYGTVHIPAHRAGSRLAAALLIPGSGLTDRDGDEPPTVMPHTLALIAATLGEDGVMSLRFDKYGTGQTGWGRYQGDVGRIDMAAFTRQAEAAYRALLAQPEVDPHAMLIVGHSEGGLQAMLVAHEVRPAPAGLALLAPQDLRLLDMVDFQLADQLDQAAAAGQITAAQAESNKAAIARAIAAFRARRPVDTSGLLPSIATLLGAMFGPLNAAFVRSDDAIYPPDVARGITHGTWTAITCGTADTNVPCPTTAPLRAALARAGVTGPGLRVLPGLDHFLHPAGTPVNDAILAPAAQRALHDFARPWRSAGRR